jgi:hypothetical protein
VYARQFTRTSFCQKIQFPSETPTDNYSIKAIKLTKVVTLATITKDWLVKNKIIPEDILRRSKFPFSLNEPQTVSDFGHFEKSEWLSRLYFILTRKSIRNIVIVFLHSDAVLDVMFADLPWSMTVYHTGQSFVTHRNADIFFNPDYVNYSKDSCLEMEFTSFSYMAVKLVFLVESKLREKLIFRTMTPLADGLRLLRANISPEMTEQQQFYILVQIRSDEVQLGPIAVIKRLILLPNQCQRGIDTKTRQRHAVECYTS